MLYRIIKDHQKLAAKRNPSYASNRFAKLLVNFMAVYWAFVLLFVGISLPSALLELDPSVEPYRLVNQGLPCLLFLDFLIRFIIQPPISREIKPYLLLPIPKKKLIGTFLLQSGMSLYNLFFFFAFVPFSYLTMFETQHATGMALYLMGIWFLMILNNYWYQLCKMLLYERTCWVLLPIALYGTLLLLELFGGPLQTSTLFMQLGEGWTMGNPLAFLSIIVLIIALYFIILQLQQKILYTEITTNSPQAVKHLSSYRFLDSFGEVGEYMKLELKLIFRNKTTRAQLRFGFLCMLGLSFILAFTDIYDGENMVRFICIYDFAAIGIMTLGKTMCYEGNYLDGLLTRNGSILPILRAKYYLNVLVLLLPFSILLFPILQGKLSLLMAVSYLSFTAGVVFCLLLQMAVYNRHTLTLNQTVIKNNKSHSLANTLLVGAAIGIPILIDKGLHSLFSANLAYTFLLVTGLFFIFTHSFWIRNIHQRFMKRRYKNMEGFRATK